MAHRSRRRHRAPFVGEPNGLNKGDDIGNRRPKNDPPPPPDDIGNRRERGSEDVVLADDLGNRVDAPPTHEISGILNEIAGPRRRKKRTTPLVRVGRFFAGGVNPLVSATTGRAQKASEEAYEKQRQEHRERQEARGDDRPRNEDRPQNDDRSPEDTDYAEGEEGEGRKKRRRRRRDGRDQVDGNVAQEVNARRARRFFDFDDDDRFDYSLKSTPEQKRVDAETAVRAVVDNAERDADVTAFLLEDGARPKILVVIDERGPASYVPKERHAADAQQPLFVLGNAALMSLNYLINKIVNRYPDDRIRLAILPKSDAPSYLTAFSEHVATKRSENVEEIAASVTAARAGIESGAKPVNGTAVKTIPAGTPVVALPGAETSMDAKSESIESDAPESDVVEKPAKKRASKKASASKKVTAAKAAAEDEEMVDEVEAPAAKKAAAKKAAAKTTTKKAAAKKSTAAKKTTTKKAVAKKAATKKAPAKKTAAKKAPAKKTAAKKTVTKKAPAKKTAAKKAPAKKATTKKAAAKKN